MADQTTITKRQASLLLLSGVISKMAHADEKGNLPSMLNWAPQGIMINLDSFTGITATMGDRTVTVTSADLFAALSGRVEGQHG